MKTTQNDRPFSRDQKRVESVYRSPKQNERDQLGLPPIKFAWADTISLKLTGVDSEERDEESSIYIRSAKKSLISNHSREK